MAPSAVIQFLCAFGLFQEGLTALIETQRTVRAAVGQEARFSCQLMQSKDVLQVTWQKLLPEGEKNLATDTKHFGQKMNPDFGDKVEFKGAGLQNSSIVIRKVTEQDEGCYRCMFNTYPEGAFTATTCLLLYELHEPVLHVRGSNSPEEAVVSCSATGRPAPTVTLSVLPHSVHFSNHSSVTNTNGTATVTTTAVLSRFHDNSTHVGCAARVPSGPQIEVFMVIPELRQAPADGFNEESGSNNRSRSWTLIIVCSVVGACVCAAAGNAVLLKPKTPNRVLEMMEMPQTKIRDTHRTEEASVTLENDQIRQRTSPEKSQASGDSDLSPSASRRLDI